MNPHVKNRIAIVAHVGHPTSIAAAAIAKAMSVVENTEVVIVAPEEIKSACKPFEPEPFPIVATPLIVPSVIHDFNPPKSRRDRRREQRCK